MSSTASFCLSVIVPIVLWGFDTFLCYIVDDVGIIACDSLVFLSLSQRLEVDGLPTGGSVRPPVALDDDVMDVMQRVSLVRRWGVRCFQCFKVLHI